MPLQNLLFGTDIIKLETLHPEYFQTRTEAILREKFFKTGVGRELIKEMITEKYVPDS